MEFASSTMKARLDGGGEGGTEARIFIAVAWRQYSRCFGQF